MIGKTISHYRIISLLGKGGMGEVYLAEDTTLNRKVALKFLPEMFTSDSERMARFEREAKLLASLNHPNIAGIYGLEKTDDTRFLALELVEGDTLADRLKRGPIPVDEALKFALQITEALEAAHGKGVIHRDLKPANIKITPEGKVKVLDFGLAKAFAGETAASELSNSPTLSDAATRQGVILGTAAYMSPEQARGKAVDKRTDIWAFGVVLYEMLAGKALFAGEDITSTLARVLERKPDFRSLPANLHPKINDTLERCLVKEAKNRCHDIADVRIEIQRVLTDPNGVSVKSVTGVEPRPKLRQMLSWAARTVVLIAIAGSAVWILKPMQPEPKRVVRFEYELPPGQQLAGGIAVSPDGSRFVYGTTNGLFLRALDALYARRISGTDKDSVQPFFSPDGQWLGYFSQSDNKLKKVAISGGAPQVLCDTSAGIAGASWDSEETIVYSDLVKGIMRVSANGGTPEILVEGNIANGAKEGFPVFPQMLPDGKNLLFTNAFNMSEFNNNQIIVQSLKSGKRKVLFKGGMYSRYLPTGHIAYTLPASNTNIGNYFAVSFDLDKLEVTGGPVSVLEGVAAGSSPDSGTLVYVPGPSGMTGAAGPASTLNTLVWVDREGKEETLGAAPKNYQSLNISPDGSKVALTVTDTGNMDIWVWDLSHQTPTRLTFDKADDDSPVWTPDGKRIVFGSNRGKTIGGIYWRSADGVGEVEPLGARPNRLIIPRSFSPDGKFLVTTEVLITATSVGTNIGMVSMEGNRGISDLLKEDYFELVPRISPDGRYMAYESDESGTDNVYVRPFPDVNGGRWQVSNNGGNSPLWSPDGRELFYRNGDATLAVDVETGPAFTHGNPRVLFRGTYLSGNILKVTSTPWDIGPDGKRFLMIKPPAATVSDSSTAGQTAAAWQTKIIVVTNWFEELKEKVPGP